MKKCQRADCNVEHDNLGRFCSRSCANKRIHSEESKLRRSLALKGKTRPATFDQESQSRKTRETRLKKYLATPFEELGSENRRRRVLEEQGNKCNKCGLDEWRGFPLTLELEHKDGNTANNSRENLEGLCPNCHSITETWRGRNKPAKNGNNEISDEELLRHLTGAASIRQGLLAAGLAAKGNNYNRAKRLLAQ